MKWSICIVTQPSRGKFLDRLMSALVPQLEEFSDVEVRKQMCRTDVQGGVLGVNRQMMIEEAPGEYVCFVDDDDLVPENYVKAIRPLLDGVDQVGFQVQTYINGKPLGPTFHSLKYRGWYTTNEGHFRDHSHVNPIRRELAVQAKFEGHGNEDVTWVDRLRKLGIVKTEHYVPEVMYFYYARNPKSDHDYPGMHGEHS